MIKIFNSNDQAISVKGNSTSPLLDYLNRSDVWTGDAKTFWQAFQLGIVYAIQLFCYQLFVLLLPQTNDMKAEDVVALTNTKDALALSLHIGMLTGSIFWSWLLLKKWTLNKALHGSLIVSAIAVFAEAFFMDRANPSSSGSEVPLLLARGLYGFGFSAGLAIALTLAAERMPKYVFTRAGAIIMSIGMMGPVFAVALPKSTELASYYLPLAGALLLVPIFFRLPKDIGFVEIWNTKNRKNQEDEKKEENKAPGSLRETSQNEISTIWQFVSEYPASRIFWACVAVGLCVSIFSDLLNILPSLYEEEALSQGKVYACRYPGMALGAIGAAYWSIRKCSRQYVINWMLMIQLVVLTALLWPKIFRANVAANLIYSMIFVSGIGNGLWLILLLHASEQIPFKYRRFSNILILAGTRAGGIFLIFFNLGYDSEWYNKYPGFLLFYGATFIIIGLVAAPFLAENFEQEAVEADLKDRPFDGELIRNRLLNIDISVWKADKRNKFLDAVRKVFFKEFYEKLGTGFYFTGLFLSEQNNPDLFKSGFEGKLEQEQTPTNQAAFDDRNDAVKGDEMREFHTKIQQVILAENSKCRPITLWMLEHPQKIGGTLLWRGGTGQRLSNDLEKEPNLRHFNLSDITFTNEDLPVKFRALLKDTDTGNNTDSKSKLALLEVQQKLLELYESATFQETSWKNFITDTKEEWHEGIKINALLHRIDSDAYKRGTYYTHYIPTFNNFNELKGTLMLKTAIPVRVEHLTALRNILSFVLLQRAAAMLELNKANNVLSLQHYFKAAHESLEARMNNIKKWFINLNQQSRFSDDEAHDFATSFVPAVNSGYHLKLLSYYSDLAEKFVHTQTSGGPDEDKVKVIREKMDEISNKPCEIKKLLMEIADELSLIAWPKITDQEGKEQLFRGLAKSIENISHHIIINSNSLLLKVVLFELLKNSIEHSNPKKPEVFITITLTNRIEVTFLNNWNDTFASESGTREAFKARFNEDNLTFKTGVGLKTVRAFLSTKSFTEQGNWETSCEYANGKTGISIYIPKSYTIPQN